MRNDKPPPSTSEQTQCVLKSLEEINEGEESRHAAQFVFLFVQKVKTKQLAVNMSVQICPLETLKFVSRKQRKS